MIKEKKFICLGCGKDTDERRYCNECKEERKVRRKMLKEMNKLRSEILK